MKKEKKGLMSKKQYLTIAKKLRELTPCNLLVFGIGEDSYLWSKINKNRITIFLEDSKEWIATVNDGTLNVEHVVYQTSVEKQKEIGYIADLHKHWLLTTLLLFFTGPIRSIIAL